MSLAHCPSGMYAFNLQRNWRYRRILGELLMPGLEWELEPAGCFGVVSAVRSCFNILPKMSIWACGLSLPVSISILRSRLSTCFSTLLSNCLGNTLSSWTLNCMVCHMWHIPIFSICICSRDELRCGCTLCQYRTVLAMFQTSIVLLTRCACSVDTQLLRHFTGEWLLLSDRYFLANYWYL